MTDISKETFKLPWPPSANHYWFIVACKGGGRKVIGKKGKLFRENVKELLGERTPHTCRLGIKLDVYPPDRRKRDLDNLLKATLDALECGGLYGDDNQIDDIQITRKSVKKGGEIVITLRSLEE